MKKHKVTLFDSSFSHAYSRNNGDLEIYSKYINFDRKNIHDIIFYTDNFIKNRYVLNFQNQSKINIAWLIEPHAIDPKIYEQIIIDLHLYDYVVSHDKMFIDTININSNRGIHYFVGGTWIEEKDWFIHNKTKNLSAIVSYKNSTEGHKLRHQIISLYKKLFCDIYGRGLNYIEYKLQGLKDYRFSLVVENSKDTFTEKLIDCFVTGTIPIYYGAQTEVRTIFNSDGILFFNNIEEFEKLIPEFTLINYLKKENAIKENFNIAKEYTISEDSMYMKIKKIF
jgi:hypothetical protein